MADIPPRIVLLRTAALRDDPEPALANETRALILPVLVASAILFGAIYVLADDYRQDSYRQRTPLATHDAVAH
jgi:hypothetical protein